MQICFVCLLRFHPGPPGRGSLLVLEYRQPALKRRPIFKAPHRGALEFDQFPSRFQQSDGRGRPSMVFGHFRRGTNVKPEVEAWIAAQRLGLFC